MSNKQQKQSEKLMHEKKLNYKKLFSRFILRIAHNFITVPAAQTKRWILMLIRQILRATKIHHDDHVLNTK